MLLRKSTKVKFVSVFITVVLVFCLILSGPAQAFTLGILLADSDVDLGEEISFVASLDIESGERLPVEYLELEIGSGVTCRFSPNGDAISGCSGLAIEKISDADFTQGNLSGNFSGTEYNFGYGYGYGALQSLSYNVTLNSSVLGQGNFSTTLKAKMSGDSTVFESDEQKIYVSVINAAFNLTVNSPQGKIYDVRRIPFNLTTTKEAKKISYINYQDNRPKEIILCKNCDEYGETRKKLTTLQEGKNNLKFISVDEQNKKVEKTVSVFIDSKDPDIKDTEPKRGFAFGNFSVEFAEENPLSLVLTYGNFGTGFRSRVLNVSSDCIFFKKDKCSTWVNLSDYDGQEIVYSFNLTDIAGNSDKSREKSLDVDVTLPKVNSFNYTIDKRRVNFVFGITEINFDEVNYVDKSDGNSRKKVLCNDLKNGLCAQIVSFQDGQHNVEFEILDEAGNTVKRNVSFVIDSKKPSIRKTEPRSGFATGEFSVQFAEENPDSLVLNYGNVPAGMRVQSLNITEDCILIGTYYYECTTQAELSNYFGQTIKYWFNLTDQFGQSDVSKAISLKVR